MNKLNLPGVKINEKQNCIEKTITFKQLKKEGNIFLKPPFQTDLDEEKINGMKKAYLKNPDYLVYKNKVVIAVVISNLNDDEYKLYVVDGQHRIEMAKELYLEEDINDYLTLCYYKIESDKKMKELFREINRDSFKNMKYVSLDDFTETLYDLTKNYIRTNYSLYFPEKKSPINRRHSLSEFMELLVEKSYLNRFENLDDLIKDLENKNKLFNKMIDYQEYYNDNSDIFYKDELTSVKNGIIISLKNNNFVDFLVDPTNVIPDHSFKTQKKMISPKLRLQVWKKEFGTDFEGYCPFYRCQNIIHNGFHCGHIISEFNGGETTLDNLKPICSECNSKMATNNWVDYEKKCKREYRLAKKQKQSSEVSLNV
jgi:hypothetical protein